MSDFELDRMLIAVARNGLSLQQAPEDLKAAQEVSVLRGGVKSWLDVHRCR